MSLFLNPKVITLAALSSLAPFAIDTYLPAFHIISKDLFTSPQGIQQSLTFYLLPYTVMLLFHGPISDSIGRIKTLQWGLVLFFLASLGWELWMTYGFAGGLPVDLRRSDGLNCAIPIHLNWILNSLADTLVVWIGLYLLKLKYKNKSPFIKWQWSAFFILLLWFVTQNIYVEAFLYHLQLGSNGDISWAPFHPLGSWFNPILFEIMGRPVTLQSQSSWVLTVSYTHLTLPTKRIV